MDENKPLVLASKAMIAVSALALMGVFTYILMPLALSIIFGVDVSSLLPASDAGSIQPQVSGEPAELNELISSFLATVIFLLIVLILILCFVVTILAIIDIVKAKKSTEWKLAWIVVCLVFSVVGPLFYAFAGRKI